MGVRIDRAKGELSQFWAEIARENAPRYKHPKEWPHLYVDFFVALCGMSYTLGHLLAVAVPLLLILS